MNLPLPLVKAPLVSDWIGFADRRVQVLTGRVELGQGNLTALLQVAADELDVDPAVCSIIGGDTTLTPDEGFTSGSLSIAVGGLALRYAASAARHILLAEAARLLQENPSALSIESGRIVRSGMDADLDLWRLAERVDLAVPVVDYAAPKPASERRLGGRPLARIDLRERVAAHPFVQDLALEGLLFGRSIHPPSMSARLLSLDMEGLRARPGVVALAQDGSFVGIVAAGEFEAIRAARWAAARAEWSEAGEAPSDPVEAIERSQEDIEIVHAAGEPGTVTGERFSTKVSRPYLSHASIGPSAAAARWDAGRLTVWTQSQGVFPLRAALAEVFAMDASAIDVHHRPGAGCYGHNGADDVALDAALMAKSVPGRPVLVTWSRADEFRYAPLGPAMVTTAEAILGPDGRIGAMNVLASSAPHGNRPGRGGPNLRAAAYLSTPFPPPRSGDVPLSSGGGADRNAVPGYAIPALSIGKLIVHDLPYRTSSLRALGGFVNVIAIESLMDEMAGSLDENPVTFRLRHLDDARARAVIEAADESAGHPFAKPNEADGGGWGLGFARYKNTAAYCAILVRVEVEEAVRVTHVHAAVDMGEIVNPDGAVNQTEGGILQSISWTLKEAVRFDGRTVATQTWDDYPILTFSEVPEVIVRLVDRPEEPPLGCAEAAQGPTAAAVVNAVYRAVGVPVRDLPLTRDRIIAALV
ncbi:molybdopterin cofactor-binding domain-containing protein [Jiella sp. M17.18]|uniref:xanthine dehydrogenase family protein molybdopterin-binding subunit n=1 Tax=Jiella sp. M17.18 TaxID=3234247 RepID=UPI0034DF30B9